MPSQSDWNEMPQSLATNSSVHLTRMKMMPRQLTPTHDTMRTGTMRLHNFTVTLSLPTP